MAPTVDEITEILNNIHEDNTNNLEVFEKALAGINNKLEMIAEDNEATDLLKLYISELKKAVEDKHSSTLVKLDNLENLQNKFKEEFEHINGENSTNIIAKVEGISDIISAMRDEFKQSVEADIENMSRLNDRIFLISDKLYSVEETLSENSKTNFNALKTTLDNLFDKIENDFSKQQEVFSSLAPDEDKIKILNTLSDDVSSLNTLLSSETDLIKTSVEENISGIKELISDTNNNICNMHTETENKLSQKLESLDVLNHAFDSSVSSLNSQLQNILGRMSDFATSAQSDEIKGMISNLISSYDYSIRAIENLNKLNEEYSVLISSLLETVLKKEDINVVLEKLSAIEAVDYSYDIEQISSKIDSLNEVFENTSAGNFENLSSKLEEIRENLNSKSTEVSDKLSVFSELMPEVKSVVEKFAGENSSMVAEKLDIFNETVKKIVTEEDFKNFRLDFADFIQKILDNSKALHLNSEANKEQILSILNKMSLLDYSQNFENIAGRIGDIKESFENNSKMNYNAISDKINNLKEKMLECFNSGSNKEDFDKLNQMLSDAVVNIQYLRDYSSAKFVEILEKISTELNSALIDSEERLNSDIGLNFNDMKLTLSNVADEINEMKTALAESDNSDKISAGFDGVQLSLESIINAFTSLGGDFKNISSETSAQMISAFNDLSGKVEDLKSEITNTVSDYLDRVCNSVKEISDKMEAFTESDNLKAEISSIKEELLALSADVQLSHDNFTEQLKNNANSQELKNLYENVDGLHTCIEDAVSSIKAYIDEFKNAADSSKSAGYNNVVEKLLDMEAVLVQNAENYEKSVNGLQTKFAEFARITETGKNDSDTKIAASIEEISSVKDELAALNEALKTQKLSSDENFEHASSVIDSSIENVIFNINNLKDSLKDGVESSVKDNMSAISDNFLNLIEVLDNIKSEYSSMNSSFVDNLEEKVISLKEEINLVNTDLTDAIQCKAEQISRAIDTIKAGVEEAVGLDIEKILEDLKSQLEISFMNLTVDLNGEIANGSETVARLEQTYKETFKKIESIEECVSEKLQNNIELLSVSILSNLKETREDIDEKLEYQMQDLKQFVKSSFTEEKTEKSIETLKEKFLNKMEALSALQNDIIQQNNLISSDISDLDDNLKHSVQTACQQALNAFNADCSKTVDALNNSFKEFNKKIESLKDDKVTGMIEALHTKVDILAMSDESSNFVDEIDDIKDLIFEQRKFFEETSDEKTAAIDKYLKDVLFKLDNVDLERNAEDIKESIMNALVSLVDQISFVEETEEIKDFVEERTDAINKNITEVQNQLKQIASSSEDDFNYSYTLQDVESDIAKLRLALTHVTDFEDVSDDIKKIVTSVESLQYSLTQDQTAELKSDIEKLNEDITSISSRTNKLLLTSDESYKALNDGLDNFSNVIYKLEDLIKSLDNTQASERIEKKIDDICKLSAEALNFDKSFNQVMTYLGEWIDGTNERISSIETNVSEISEIKNNIDELRQVVPEKTEVLDNLEQKFAAQETRIGCLETKLDSLENKLDTILSTLEEKDDTVLNRKADKIEKLISKLGANIEKLASYVDEE